MTADFLEYHFLTSCYEKGIDDKSVYTLFLKKVISDLAFPASYSMSELHHVTQDKYHVEIPPTYIKEIVKEICLGSDAIFIKNETITIKKIPVSIEEHIKTTQLDADADGRLIFEEFNAYLEFNEVARINYKEFKDTLLLFCKRIVGDVSEPTDLAKEFANWITIAYRIKDKNELRSALDKVIYSWLVYRYFYAEKRQKKKLQNFKIAFDTNILAYLLGVNGNERKKYVEYLLDKIKQNSCKVVLHDYSIKELDDLLDSDSNIEIRIYNKEFPTDRKQIKYNGVEYFKALFKLYGVIYEYNSNQKRIDNNSEYYTEIKSNLKKYKERSRPTISDDSLYHDIMLLHSQGDIHKINNIYEEHYLIATCDNALYRWFEGYIKLNYSSEYSLLMNLERLNLVFWIESDKARSSEFLMNTWMYVSETIHYFGNYSVDEYFKRVRDEFERKIPVPDNWRSPYILIKRNLEGLKDDITEGNIDEAIDKISSTMILENDALRSEVISLREELNSVKISIESSKKTNERENHNTVVNVNVTPIKSNGIEAMTIIQLIKEIFLRIISIFKKWGT